MTENSDAAKLIESFVFVVALLMAFLASGYRSIAGAIIVATMVLGSDLKKGRA